MLAGVSSPDVVEGADEDTEDCKTAECTADDGADRDPTAPTSTATTPAVATPAVATPTVATSTAATSTIPSRRPSHRRRRDGRSRETSTRRHGLKRRDLIRNINPIQPTKINRIFIRKDLICFVTRCDNTACSRRKIGLAETHACVVAEGAARDTKRGDLTVCLNTLTRDFGARWTGGRNRADGVDDDGGCWGYVERGEKESD